MSNTTEKAPRKKGMIRVRGGFSDNSGISPCNTEIQIEEFDDYTRIKISNTLFGVLESIFKSLDNLLEKPVDNSAYYQGFCRAVLCDVFNEVYSQGASSRLTWRDVFAKIHRVIMEAEYNEVLDVIYYICTWIYNHIDKLKPIAYDIMNEVFEEEYVGYRFVDGKIISITSKEEIKAIEAACNNLFDGCRKQMQNAVGFLSDREKKDYKNCIKESISAVESLCQVIAGDKKATLSDALKKIGRNGTAIHPALNQAFQKLYAYTSDQGGIRHAEGMFESNVTFEEAKFMLVSCSAFINYLIAEYGKGSK